MKKSLFLLLVLFCCIAVAQAATFTVNSTIGGGDGTCDATNCTLREAINAANDAAGDDIISFEAATFGSSSQTINLFSALPTFSTNIDLQGPGANRLTVRRAPGITAEFRIFQIGPAATVRISGLAIHNGKVSSLDPVNAGGGILNDHGTLTVEQCTLIGNSAGYGGGIYNDGSGDDSTGAGATLNLSNCTLNSNEGAAVYSNGSSGSATLRLNHCKVSNNQGSGIVSDGDYGSGAVEVSNSTISGNSAGSGGGINCFDGTLTVTDSTISGNSTSDSGAGGGISIYYGTATIKGSTLYDNRAGRGGGSAGGPPGGGGGIYCGEGSLSVTNCTLTRNTAAGGGGIYLFISGLTLLNSTISGNTCGDRGGGIGSRKSSYRLYNSIVAGNTATSYDGTSYYNYTDLTWGPSGTNSITTVSAAEAGLEVDSAGKPILKDNGGLTKTIALMPGSPAIAAGDDTKAPATDQRGYTRNGKSDIGAFEFNGVPPLPYRADALIKKKSEPDSAYGNDNVYQQSPVHGQIQAQSINSGSTAVYQVKVQNDTDTARTFGVRSVAGPGSGWTILYKSGTTDISSAIKSSAGYTTGLLAPGASEIIIIRMTPDARADSIKSITLKVFLGGSDKITRDAVQAITTIAASSASS